MPGTMKRKMGKGMKKKPAGKKRKMKKPARKMTYGY